jgi:hypothetical protein
MSGPFAAIVFAAYCCTQSTQAATSSVTCNIAVMLTPHFSSNRRRRNGVRWEEVDATRRVEGWGVLQEDGGELYAWCRYCCMKCMMNSTGWSDDTCTPLALCCTTSPQPQAAHDGHFPLKQRPRLRCTPGSSRVTITCACI